MARLARVPRQVHLAAGALPASGAYTSQAAYKIPDGVQAVTFYVAYTRGAPGGWARFQALVGNNTEEAVVSTLDPSLTVAQPLGKDNVYLTELDGPQPQDGNAINFAITVLVRGGETTVRLLAAEAGQVGSPGNCAITLTAGF